MIQLFRVMGMNDYGQSFVELDGCTTLDEALAEVDAMSNTFPDVTFYAEPYVYEEPIERTYTYPNSVDGWEDIYPLDGY